MLTQSPVIESLHPRNLVRDPVAVMDVVIVPMVQLRVQVPILPSK
jgi:hypothetical protein